MTRRLGYFGLAFGSGFAVLTIEIAGARLIAPVFGLSVVPWTAVIGVILGALAVGSHLGGRWADAGRIPLSRVLLFAGLSGALPVVGAGFPWIARDLFGFIPGAVVSALFLFAPPVLCLGAVVPYLVQADTESLGTVGRRAGDLSAAATAGSILGSFTTGFVLLPAMPLPVLLGTTAGALVAMSMAADRLFDGVANGGADAGANGAADAGTEGEAEGGPEGGAEGEAEGEAAGRTHGRTNRGPVLAALVALPALGVLGSGSPEDTLYDEQTLYSSVSVTERTWADGRVVRELWQNGGSSSAEYVDSGEPAHVYARMSLELLDSLEALPERVLVLGGAALTLPVAFRARDPRVAIDVVEIDRVVTRLATEYFAYGTSKEGISVLHEDARVFLRGSAGGYDLVYLDVFDHLLTVPWTMVTAEALQDMSAELAPGGVFVANVLSPLEGPGTAFLERFSATLDEAFVEVRLYLTDSTLDRGATQNLIVVASNDEGSLPDLDWATAPVPASGRPLTDMWAPVEYLQARVFAQGLRWR